MFDEKLEFKEWLKIIYQLFPDAEIVRGNGLREKLSEIFRRAIDVKSQRPISRQSKNSHKQMSLDFGDNCECQQRGGT